MEAETGEEGVTPGVVDEGKALVPMQIMSSRRGTQCWRAAREWGARRWNWE